MPAEICRHLYIMCGCGKKRGYGKNGMRNTLQSLIDKSPDDFVSVVYQGRKTPHVVSSTTLRPLGVNSYGFYGKGKVLVVHKKDVELRPNIFVPVTKEADIDPTTTHPKEIDATRGAFALAEENGIDLSLIEKEGRITKKDVEAVING